jgi:hypothetical protein
MQAIGQDRADPGDGFEEPRGIGLATEPREHG